MSSSGTYMIWSSSSWGRLLSHLGASGVGSLGTVGIPSFPGRSGNVAGSPCGSSPPELCSSTEVRSGTAAWPSDSTLFCAFSCWSRRLKIRWVASILERLSFFFGMAFPRFRGSFDGSAGFWQIRIRRIPVIGKIDSRYVWCEQGPFGTNRRDSIRKTGGAYSLSNILLAGGQ